MLKPWMILTASAFLFSSCSASSIVPAKLENSTVPVQSSDAGSKTAAVPAVDQTASNQPKPSSETEKETLPKMDTSQTAPFKYSLNPKTYDIVPIDPNAASKKVVLLTFDDGPKDLDMNKTLMDTLDKHHAKAIFFLNGYRIKQKPDIVKLIAARGQSIGNHSWDHIDLKKESKEKIDQQIGDVQKAVKEITGKAPSFFRPPFGSGNDDVRAKAKEEQLLYMTWSNGSKDWEMTTKNNHPEQVVANVMQQLHFGSNILMHELPWTVEALDSLLTKLEEAGYGFVDPESIEIKL